MGALTSKKTQFNYRPWENKIIDSADSLDSFCVPIQVNIRGNEIIRVLPRLSIDKKFNWISDRTRFFIDGLTQQRIQTPLWRKQYQHTQDSFMKHIRNVKSTSFFSVSWHFGFNLIKRHYTSSSTTIIGPTADYPSIAMASNIFNNVTTNTGTSRIPVSSMRHLAPLQTEGPVPTDKNNQKETIPLSLQAALFFMELQKPPIMRHRRVGYIIVNLNLRRFPLLQLYIQQLSSERGYHQNSFYLFGNNYSMWDPITESLGDIKALPEYLAGRMTGVVQMEQFDTVVFLNGRWGEAPDFLSADDLAKLLLDNDWGVKHERIYVFDLPNSMKDYATYYLNIRNSFFPRWQPAHVNFDNFLFLHEEPHVATTAHEDTMDNVYETLTLDKDEKALGIFVRFSHPDWRKAPGVRRKFLESTQPAHRRITFSANNTRTLGSLSSFKVSYGTHRSETSSGCDLALPSRVPYEGTTHHVIDCFGRIVKFAFCYSGPTYSKDRIDMFTELADFLQLPFCFYTPSPLSFASVSSTLFFVETPSPIFSNIFDTYFYDEYRIDAITKASSTMALCSERFTPADNNFELLLLSQT